jgi:hypothetical protein
MQVFPKFVVNFANRLLAKVPPRFQRSARIGLTVAAVLFAAFELSRVWIAARDFMLPLWQTQFQTAQRLADGGNWLALAIAAVIFVIPMAALVWALKRLKARPA